MLTKIDNSCMIFIKKSISKEVSGVFCRKLNVLASERLRKVIS